MAVRSWLDRATDWLSAPSRQRIYQLLLALGSLVALTGFFTQDFITGLVGTINAGLAFLGMALASVKARRFSAQAFYVAAAAVIAALEAWGMVTGDQASHWNDLLTQVLVIVGPAVALYRTDPSTPTGEPMSEWEPKHAAP